LGELNSGSAYKEFVKNIPDQENTIVVPIIILGMEQLLMVCSRNLLNHFSFTLGIFWQHICAKPSAWRNLGYI